MRSCLEVFTSFLCSIESCIKNVAFAAAFFFLTLLWRGRKLYSRLVNDQSTGFVVQLRLRGYSFELQFLKQLFELRNFHCVAAFLTVACVKSNDLVNQFLLWSYFGGFSSHGKPRYLARLGSTCLLLVDVSIMPNRLACWKYRYGIRVMLISYFRIQFNCVSRVRVHINKVAP